MDKLKESKCIVQFACSANPFDAADCIYFEPVKGAMEHTKCKYWHHTGCMSAVAAVNAMTLQLKRMTE